MKTIYYLLTVLILASSCKKENQNIEYNLDAFLQLYIENNEGMDLLNPDNADSYKMNDIKVYYVINGEKVLMQNAYEGQPPALALLKYGNERNYHLTIPLNYQDNITLLQWNETDTDTILGEKRQNERAIIYDKVWYNDELRWECCETDRKFTIIK